MHWTQSEKEIMEIAEQEAKEAWESERNAEYAFYTKMGICNTCRNADFDSRVCRHYQIPLRLIGGRKKKCKHYLAQRMERFNTDPIYIIVHPRYTRFLINNVQFELHLHSYDKDADLIAARLKLIKSLMKGDGSTCKHNNYDCQFEHGCLALSMPESECEEYIPQYDSSLIMLIDRSAYEDITIPAGRLWHSNHCQRTYEFCKANYIRVLDRNIFMNERKEIDV